MSNKIKEIGIRLRHVTHEQIIIGFTLLVLVAVGFASNEQKPFTSAEVQFADTSYSGLAIVPASCPSPPPARYTRRGGLFGECPAGYQYQNDRCVLVEYLTRCSAHTCPDGSPIPSNGMCPGGGCPSGYHLVGGTCERLECPLGWIVQSNSCVFVGCPSGYFQQGSRCVQQCIAQYFCSGSDLYFKNTQCVDSFYQSCTWGCTSGACNPPPSPQGEIRVSPALVKSGDTTQVIWSTQYVSSCTVAGTNGNSWTDLSSGAQGKTSSPIAEQVTFTLSCNALQGATPPTLTKSAIVNLLPFWQED